MRRRDYFPLGLATGLAFCNRHDETDVLINNISNGKHTVLMATRRYGKSSLALHALKRSKFAYAEVDFYMARNEKTVESYILNGVVELIGKALGPVDQLITSIKKFVKSLQPKLNIGVGNIQLELTSTADVDPANNIKEALLLLERLLEEKKQPAVLLFDEFQAVGVIAQGQGIEGAIRHVAQKTKYLSFIFSGSNRKLLKNMFEDEARPLYKLCWKLSLTRIKMNYYQTHLQAAALSAWGQKLTDSVIDKIVSITERHPYYFNKLCDRLWAVFQKPPSVKQIEEIWLGIICEEKSDAVKEISLLSLGQKNVLVQIAKNPLLSLTSKQAMLNMQITSSSIVAALEGLEEKDIIEKEDNRYQIINPIVKFYVLKNE